MSLGTTRILNRCKRQMGTIELQKEIKHIISQLGWSQNELARIIYTELHDSDHPEEIRKFKERLKKDLSRSTTNEEKLRSYINIITQQRKFENSDTVINKYKPTQVISSFLSRGMSKLSKELDEQL